MIRIDNLQSSNAFAERSNIFGAGPAGLPTLVLMTAAKALVNYDDTGQGPTEHSHRSELATNIINATKADLAEYLDISDSYEILFRQGGGSGELRPRTTL